MLWGFLLNVLSRANAGVRAIEEEAHNKQDSHSSGSGYQPERKYAFRPAASPGHRRSAIRVAIGDSTVGIWGFFTAHGINLS